MNIIRTNLFVRANTRWAWTKINNTLSITSMEMKWHQTLHMAPRHNFFLRRLLVCKIFHHKLFRWDNHRSTQIMEIPYFCIKDSKCFKTMSLVYKIFHLYLWAIFAHILSTMSLGKDFTAGQNLKENPKLVLKKN